MIYFEYLQICIYYGGAIHNNIGELTITESALTESALTEYTTNRGEAIQNRSELTIIESTFNENTAKGSGGVIYNKNGE